MHFNYSLPSQHESLAFYPGTRQFIPIIYIIVSRKDDSNNNYYRPSTTVDCKPISYYYNRESQLARQYFLKGVHNCVQNYITIYMHFSLLSTS